MPQAVSSLKKELQTLPQVQAGRLDVTILVMTNWIVNRQLAKHTQGAWIQLIWNA